MVCRRTSTDTPLPGASRPEGRGSSRQGGVWGRGERREGEEVEEGTEEGYTDPDLKLRSLCGNKV